MLLFCSPVDTWFESHGVLGMDEISWGMLQRLFDDDPPLVVWREERGLEIKPLADRSGIAFDQSVPGPHQCSRYQRGTRKSPDP